MRLTDKNAARRAVLVLIGLCACAQFTLGVMLLLGQKPADNIVRFVDAKNTVSVAKIL